MQHLAIRAELAQAILNYLTTQPYGNVWQMVQELQQAQPTDQDGQRPKLVSKDDDAA